MNEKPKETVNQPPKQSPPREEKPRRTERGFSDYPLEEEKQEDNPAKPSVFMAMPTSGNVPVEVVAAILTTISALRDNAIPTSFIMYRTATLCGARCIAMAEFLRSKANRLLLLDSDIVWQPADVLRLLRHSIDMDIVVAAYATKTNPTTVFINMETQPVITNGHGCVPIKSTGLGFAMLSRHVAQVMSESAPLIALSKGEVPVPQVFSWGIRDGEFRGEDVGFLEEAKARGFQCWLDPSIVLGHIGQHIYSAQLKFDYEVKNGPSE